MFNRPADWTISRRGRGPGAAVSPEHIRATLASVYKYNYKRTLGDYEKRGACFCPQ